MRSQVTLNTGLLLKTSAYEDHIELCNSEANTAIG